VAFVEAHPDVAALAQSPSLSAASSRSILSTSMWPSTTGTRLGTMWRFWLWDDIEPRWLAEASYMRVGEVRDLAESQPIVAFHCLDCGEQLQARNRRHLIRMHHSLRAQRRSEIGTNALRISCASPALGREGNTPKISVA
jgi:hypothetical protein